MIEHIVIFKVPGYTKKNEFYCDQGKPKYYKSILEVRTDCTQDPECKMFYEQSGFHGEDITFQICYPTAKEEKAGRGSFLYVKGKSKIYSN